MLLDVISPNVWASLRTESNYTAARWISLNHIEAGR